MIRAITKALKRLRPKKPGIELIRVRRPFAAIVPKGFDARKDNVAPLPYHIQRCANDKVSVGGYHKAHIAWETGPDDARYPNHVIAEHLLTGERQLIPRFAVTHIGE